MDKFIKNQACAYSCLLSPIARLFFQAEETEFLPKILIVPLILNPLYWLMIFIVLIYAGSPIFVICASLFVVYESGTIVQLIFLVLLLLRLGGFFLYAVIVRKKNIKCSEDAQDQDMELEIDIETDVENPSN